MLGNHNRKDSLSKAGAGRLCSQPGGGGVRGEGGCAESSYIPDPLSRPSLPLLFLLHPGRLRGHPRSEEPSASTPGHSGRGAPAVRLCGGLGRSRPPPLSPASLARPLPGHMGSRAPVGDLSPQRSPSRRPRRSPLPEGMGTLPHSHSAHSALLQEGTEAGERNLPSPLALQSAKAPRPLRDWVEGIVPLQYHPLPGGVGKWGAPAPSPPPLETWALLAGAERDAAETRRGPQGRGQVAGGDGWVCVPSR